MYLRLHQFLSTLFTEVCCAKISRQVGGSYFDIFGHIVSTFQPGLEPNQVIATFTKCLGTEIGPIPPHCHAMQTRGRKSIKFPIQIKHGVGRPQPGLCPFPSSDISCFSCFFATVLADNWHVLVHVTVKQASAFPGSLNAR